MKEMVATTTERTLMISSLGETLASEIEMNFIFLYPKCNLKK